MHRSQLLRAPCRDLQTYRFCLRLASIGSCPICSAAALQPAGLRACRAAGAHTARRGSADSPEASVASTPPRTKQGCTAPHACPAVPSLACSGCVPPVQAAENAATERRRASLQSELARGSLRRSSFSHKEIPQGQAPPGSSGDPIRQLLRSGSRPASSSGHRKHLEGGPGAEGAGLEAAEHAEASGQHSRGGPGAGASSCGSPAAGRQSPGFRAAKARWAA